MINASKYDNFYDDYYKIDSQEYYERVKFYEHNPIAVSLLDFHRRLDIKIDYVICLFELGEYESYLDNVEPLIMSVIKENIYEMKGRDIFIDLIFKKGASLYNLKRYDEGLQISQQLLKMKSQLKLIILHNKCKRGVLLDKLMVVKSIIVGLLIGTIALGGVHLFIVKPYFSYLSDTLLMVVKVFLGMIALILVFQELFLRKNVRKELMELHKHRNSKTKNYYYED